MTCPSTTCTLLAAAARRRAAMAKQFEPNVRRRILDAVMGALVRVGLGPPRIVLLTARGRKSGRLYRTPVTPIEYDGKRYLVSPYGERDWVKNARAAGRVVLSRGRHHETVAVTPVPPAEAAPVLREYINQIGLVRPYFDVTPQSSTDEFE